MSRPKKGEIPKKIKILRFIAEQKIVTARQISKRYEIKETTAVRLFAKLHLEYIRFGRAGEGIWQIKDKEIMELIAKYYSDSPVFKAKGFVLPEVYHCLRITDIRILLELFFKQRIIDWQSEEYIRSLPAQVREFPYEKTPDAVFSVDFTGEVKRFYLEYERSFKSPGRYKNIFSFYDNQNHIQAGQIIYVCESTRIKELLKRMPKIDVKYVFYTWQELQAKYEMKNEEAVINDQSIKNFTPANN